jgi:hypothetical protein
MKTQETALEVVEESAVATASSENLQAIANEINETHAVAKTHAQLAVVFAIRTGVLCERAKESLKHTEFGPWIEKHCPLISERTAQRYMALVRSIKNDTVSLLGSGSKTDTVSDLQTTDLTAPDFLSKIESDTAYRDQIAGQVKDVLGEGSLTDLYREYGVVRSPRNIDPETGKRVHYENKKSKLTPDQLARQNRAAAMALFTRALGDLQAALNDKQARRWLQPKDWVSLRKLAHDRITQLDVLASKAEAAAAKEQA